MNTWLLLIYKVPNEPSAARVYVWRKLKSLGALLLHDSAWVLPATARTREKLQWLTTEIIERGGEAMLWEAQQASFEQAFEAGQRPLSATPCWYCSRPVYSLRPFARRVCFKCGQKRRNEASKRCYYRRRKAVLVASEADGADNA